MHARLILLSTMALVLGAAAAEPIEVRFASPAQSEGDVSASGVETLLLVTRGEPASFRLETHGTTTWTQTEVDHFRTDARAAGAAWRGSAPERQASQELPAGTSVDVRLAGPWASILVHGTDLRVQADGAFAIRAIEGPYSVVAPENRPFPAATVRALDLAPRQVLVQADVAEVIRLHGSIMAVEWHNATVECARAPCPADARSTTTHVDHQAARVEHMVATYGRLDGPVDVAGHAWSGALWAAAERLDLHVNGSVRLPLASTTDCRGCRLDVDGQSLLAEGRLQLLDLRPARTGQLVAGVHGDVSAARADELSIIGRTVLPAGAAITVGAVLTLVARFLAPLLTRFGTEEEALKNASRAAVYHAVVSSPGVSYREIQRRTSLGNGTVNYHLAVLHHNGLVMKKKDRNLVRYYENHGRYDRDWKPVARLRDDRLHRLYEYVRANPWRNQSELLAAATSWGWPRSSAQERIVALERAGLLLARREGRFKLYAAVEGVITDRNAGMGRPDVVAS